MKRSSELSPVDVAIAAARAGGRILRRGFGQVQRIRHKGPVNLVTEQDHRSEEAIIRTIHAAFPTHAVLAEERGQVGLADEHCWIIDPLDGTTNYAHGYPVFCISIAYERRGMVEVGVIFDVLRGEMFVGQRGGGATLNGRPISVSRVSRLIDSLIATGFPYERERMPTAIAQFRHLAYQTQGLRRAGAAALSLAYVAAGRLDGFWEASLAPWDHAAGSLLIEEAGGMVSQLDGQPYAIGASSILASNGLLHADLLREIARAGGADSASADSG
jgi:myo-inositol-1(or 4)-monophosphatase